MASEVKIDAWTGKPFKEIEDNTYNQDRIDRYAERFENPGNSSSDKKNSDPKGQPEGGRRRTLRIPKGVHVKAKTLKRMLKSKGLKTTGKKSTLRARARKAHLIRGGGK